MNGIIGRIFHVHQWEVMVKNELCIYENGANPEYSLPIERKYVVIQRCPICGKVKKNIITID